MESLCAASLLYRSSQSSDGTSAHPFRLPQVEAERTAGMKPRGSERSKGKRARARSIFPLTFAREILLQSRSGEGIATKIDRAVFPGSQGGPLMHVIAGKAVCFGEALEPSFKDYSRKVVDNAQALASALKSKGYRLVSDGTDNHLMLVDLRDVVPDNTGKEVAFWLEKAGIITNHNGIPKDPRPPMQTSGIRLGTPAVTTRNMGVEEMVKIAEWIDRVIVSKGDSSVQETVKNEIFQFCSDFPLPH